MKAGEMELYGGASRPRCYALTRCARSQQIFVVEEFGVLTGLPKPEQTEVEVHLDHLLA